MRQSDIPSGKYNAAILRFLQAEGMPRSAYDILEALREEGAKAPMQIYRALAKLETAGLAHKLPKSNSWIACHSHGHHHDEVENLLVLLSCQSCGTVAELQDDRLQSALRQVTTDKQFNLPAQTIEVDGLCHPCQNNS